ncbi:kinetochore protein SLK19-like isoform X2 [Aphis craccivora]|uniref:Kinetochore protein SLK19-like isoform X2 n=1 Tax=Aphis craccivora TaxID=307492 RepID=A0A6G0ZA68_APHCR|nr:kinetochore protein SLK19-like isoform X2 [Aphis craccivora]
MNKLQSDDLNAIVNIQYGIGFELIEGQIEIEITVFNETKKSKTMPACRNRINFYEEFMWKIDKATLKYGRSTNAIVKIECFRTTEKICFGNIYKRQRIGHVIIKLKEFQIIGRNWDQSISIRGYKLLGTNRYIELVIVLIIQEDNLEFENFIDFKKGPKFNNKEINTTKQSSELNKQELYNKYNNEIIQDNVSIYKTQKEKNDRINQINEQEKSRFSNILEKQESRFHEILNKCEELLNSLNIDNKHEQFCKKGMHNINELNTVKKKVEQSIKESKDSLKSSGYNEHKLSELLATCLKHTDEWLKVMQKIKKDIEVNKLYKCSSNSFCNSSIQSENDFERPTIIVKEIKKKLNELIEYITNMHNKVKNNKSKRSREISTLKNASCVLSKVCDIIAKKIGDDR